MKTLLDPGDVFASSVTKIHTDDSRQHNGALGAFHGGLPFRGSASTCCSWLLNYNEQSLVTVRFIRSTCECECGIPTTAGCMLESSGVHLEQASRFLRHRPKIDVLALLDMVPCAKRTKLLPTIASIPQTLG